VADTLDQDVHALQEWLRRAWRDLGQPSLTRFERQELRNYMKEADAALRSGLEKLAARDRIRREKYTASQSARLLPGFRILTGSILPPAPADESGHAAAKQLTIAHDVGSPNVSGPLLVAAGLP
jgi:hypothetical protein